MNYWKITKFSLLIIFSTIILLYGAFIGLLVFTENHWIEEEPFHSSIDQFSTTPHKLTPIDTGIYSLGQRLKLIEEARSTIDLEFFIYELDAASRIVTDALIDRAKQGVKIRLLVDFSFAVLELRPTYARYLREAGISVKYYNTASISRFFAVQHRTHRKLLIADGKKVILGGRNVGDDYFDLSETYNFLDSDLLIEGDIVATILNSFDLYWDSPWSSDIDTVADDDGKKDEVDKIRLSDHDKTIAAQATQFSIDLPSYKCNKIRFVTDYPGSGVNYRKVYRAIAETVGTAQHEILVESPYFIIRSDGLELIKNITKSGVKMEVLTNSLKSTDAYYTIAAMYPDLSDLHIPNFKLHAYNGEPPRSYLGPIHSKRWGVHSKRAVVDGRTILLGTYNIDPRSANLNSELMIACYDSPELALVIKDDLNKRIAQSDLVIDELTSNRQILLKDAKKEELVKMYLSIPIANLFNFLL